MNKDLARNRFALRITGPIAHWGTVPTGAERTSLPVPTASAAIGIGRQVLGKRGFHVWPIELRLFQKPILRPEGVQEFSDPSRQERTLRTRVMAYGNDFAILYGFEVSPHADPDDNIHKFRSMLESRLRRGTYHGSIALGQRENVGYAEWIEDWSTLESPIDYSENLGLTYYGQDWHQDRQAYLAQLVIEHGVVCYPSWDDVRAHGIPFGYRATVAA